MSVDSGDLQDLGFSITFSGNQAVLGVGGEIDLVSAPEFAGILDGIIDRGHVSVVLNVAEVTFMAAAGLGVIGSAAGRLGLLGGELVIRSPSAMVTRLLDATGLAAVARIEQPASLDRLGPEQSKSAQEVAGRFDHANLAGHLRTVGAIPADDDVIDGALRLVVALARATVGGADGVSVSLRRHGRLATVASSDQTVLDMDAEQYTTREGPCVDASVEGRWFHIESLDRETRWPAFVPRAKELGICAILSSPLLAEDRSVGALNIYSRTVAAFGPEDQALASTFAAEASKILTGAGLAVSDDELSDRLQRALATRDALALARGVIMERDGLSSDEAFASLRRLSQKTSTPLSQLSAEVGASTVRHGPPPADGTPMANPPNEASLPQA